MTTAEEEYLEENKANELHLITYLQPSIRSDLEAMLKQYPKPASTEGLSENVKIFYEHAEVRNLEPKNTFTPCAKLSVEAHLLLCRCCLRARRRTSEIRSIQLGGTTAFSPPRCFEAQPNCRSFSSLVRTPLMMGVRKGIVIAYRDSDAPHLTHSVGAPRNRRGGRLDGTQRGVRAHGRPSRCTTLPTRHTPCRRACARRRTTGRRPRHGAQPSSAKRWPPVANHRRRRSARLLPSRAAPRRAAPHRPVPRRLVSLKV